MKKTKKHIKWLATCMIIISCIAMPVNAEEINFSSERKSIDFSSIAENSDVSVSAVMTFQEMVERYAENAGITYQEALTKFPVRPAIRATRGEFYRVFSAALDVAEDYKPHLEFFCVTAEGGELPDYKVDIFGSTC